MIRLTRRYRFSASHRLHSTDLSDAENRALYDKCNNLFGHGHNYQVEISVRGPVNPRTGRVAWVGLLDELVRREVVEPFDRCNLNSDIPEFRNMVPTSENLAIAIERRLRARWPAGFAALDRVRIRETRKNAFELRIV
jgi:6-pyruvoyltetrahydropterin/6-carboxytetrahydropterin synthase